MAKKTGLFDLETNFAFYGAYHSNPINIFIHILFVWPLVFTSLMFLYFTPSIYDLSEIGLVGHHGLLLVNFGFLFTLVYALFYMCLDIKAGSLAALLCFACWVGASFVSSGLGYSLAWKVVLAAQLFCWTGQFLGHGVFEKRAPALLDNLTQAFLMAPFFVILELLEKAFGYEPYSGFHAKVKAKVAKDIKEWQEKKQKKSI
ncbi:2-hydroxy-palmitic acid dioxygenase MPO1 [Mercurialis annua]|uniref:2-hydroxy-palmitic acid dioxygenase MPO1 n=1 Tax=Mercurialis annua TaxID=3986 RepID=UPI0021601959|nr:2-hydroxy-palmitic acid dioxygenase MPO1 [Mercurialis annua]